MQTPEDLAVWLQCNWMFFAIHFAAYRDRFRAWRVARREKAQRDRKLGQLDLWMAATPAPVGSSRLRRLAWDMEQASGLPYLHQFTSRHD